MRTLLNGNEAAAIVAQLLNERVYTYQTLPASNVIDMNIWDQKVQLFLKDPKQDPLSHVFASIDNSESTTALLSSPLLLSAVPSLYKLAVNKCPFVIHAAAQHAQLESSFSDFTQIMATRDSGMAFICSSNVQEVYDLAIIAHYVSLAVSTPVLHFYDSKRIADESCSIQLFDKDTSLSIFKEKPVEQKDIHLAFTTIAKKLAEKTGRSYAPMEYIGHPKAECVIVAMGAGATVVEQILQAMSQELKLGLLKIRLYRPWSRQACIDALPSTVKRIAVLEPTLETPWNPLFLDIASTLDDADVFSGLYGIDEIDFSPNAVVAVAEGLLDNTLDRQFQVSTLSVEPIELQLKQQMDQLVFANDIHLANTFAAQYKHAQVYTVQDTTHVRVTNEELCGTFMPSLIQQADAVILPPSYTEASVITALNRLKIGGFILIEQDMDSLDPSMKNLAHTKKASLIVVNQMADTLCRERLSDIFNHEHATPVPGSWSEEQANPVAKKPSPPNTLDKMNSVEQSYIKILEQAFGDRLNIANAYNACSIWSTNTSHPNAATPEFGYGRLVNLVQDRTRFIHFVMQTIQGAQLPTDVLRVLSQWLLRYNSPHPSSQKIQESAERVVQVLPSVPDQAAQTILNQKELLFHSSNWLIGSDTWAYDLGASGLHHVITSNDNINLLIIDTTSYSQPVEREKRKKDIGLYAMNFGSVYVASVALYASYTGVLQAFMEAEAYQGPSIVLAYLPYHPNDPVASLKETKVCVDNGAWPLYRWNPSLNDKEMFKLDSQRIQKELENFLSRENQLSQLVSMHPDISETLSSSLESGIKTRHDEMKAKARADYARLLSGLGSAQDGPPLTILFGSDNGNGEGLAKKIATRAQYKGCQVKWMAMDDYGDIQDLANEVNILIICSTAGQGEMPSNAREFWKTFNSLISGDVNLADVNYAVFGLGDSHYWPREEDALFYNRPGKLLDAKFENLGATRLVSLGLGDDQDDDGFETGFNAWIPEFWKSIGIKDMDENFVEPVYTDDQMKIDSNYLRGNISQELADYSTGSVSEVTGKLLKFHGTYLQDDRDLQEERKKEGREKAYSFLIRVRTPGGVATPKQWLVMDNLSEKHANKTLKLTTRQAFQLHGVLKKNLRTTIRNINKSLLSTLAACGDVNRNIMCTTLTEIPEIRSQVQKLVVELKDLLAPQTSAYHEIWLDNSMVAGHAVQDFEPIYGPSYLPRKFKIVIAVPPSNDVDVYAHDLGLIAIADKESKTVCGYNVLIGGGMGQTHGNKKTYPRPASLIGYVPADKVLDVAKAVVLTQRDHGDRANRKHARFKYTIDDLGLDFIQNEIENKSGVKFEEARPFQFKDNADQYGWVKGDNDTWNFTMFIENGRVKDTPEFLCKTGLRELAKFHKGEFRLTPNQHLVIANIPQQDLEKTKDHLTKYKMDNMSFSGIRKTSMACVALPTCGLAMAESERYLPSLITLLEKAMEEAGLRDDTIVTRMTGCPNGCARPYLAELGFVGKPPDTYNIYLGGSRKGERLNKLYKENMKEQDILEELTPMIKRYALERFDNEPFGDWVIRAGYVKQTMDGKDFHENTFI